MERGIHPNVSGAMLCLSKTVMNDTEFVFKCFVLVSCAKGRLNCVDTAPFDVTLTKCDGARSNLFGGETFIKKENDIINDTLA